ncbi:MAG: hypothetical protein KKA62_00415 [Nanoarchaeota archaeon]|nr:hypothetical protein [Nanoarchaeota archaeon]MBU1643901.1 hypothetical protein [Nanoarchaeota archaeon]MBU1976399.1 hypothetical protein [Nanoarchaeota archaeon]
MKKKGAIALSMDFLVVIIISLVILAGGITLVYKFIGGAEEIKSDLDKKTTDELERLLVGQGQKVALPLHVADVPRGDTHIFGLGIMNMKESTETFFISLELSKVVDAAEADITNQVDKSKVKNWVLFDGKGIMIEPGNSIKEPLLVNIPKDAVKGQYIFSVKVSTSGEVYGNAQKFFVNVI